MEPGLQVHAHDRGASGPALAQWLVGPQSIIYNTIANPLPPPDDYGPTPRLDLFNASIGWVDDAHRWRVSLEARNLTNKRYVDAGFTQSNAISPGVVGYLGNPRETWIRVGYSF